MSDSSLDPTSFAMTWTLGPDGSFNDPQKEKFAMHLGGGKTIAEASRLVGITGKTGLLWAKNPDMKERKRILRAQPGISQTFSVSIAMIVAELHRNAMEARAAEQFKASNDALQMMYTIAKQEKSLLETFEAKGEESGGSGNIVDRLKNHLSAKHTLPAGTVTFPPSIEATVVPEEDEGGE